MVTPHVIESKGAPLCPACGALITVAAHLDGRPPEKGDVSVCVRCQAIAEVEDPTTSALVPIDISRVPEHSRERVLAIQRGLRRALLMVCRPVDPDKAQARAMEITRMPKMKQADAFEGILDEQCYTVLGYLRADSIDIMDVDGRVVGQARPGDSFVSADVDKAVCQHCHSLNRLPRAQCLQCGAMLQAEPV